VDVITPTELRVTVTGRVDYLFAPAVPGAARSALVQASAIAVMR